MELDVQTLYMSIRFLSIGLHFLSPFMFRAMCITAMISDLHLCMAWHSRDDVVIDQEKSYVSNSQSVRIVCFK